MDNANQSAASSAGTGNSGGGTGGGDVENGRLIPAAPHMSEHLWATAEILNVKIPDEVLRQKVSQAGAHHSLGNNHNFNDVC